jgi:hypothetical protein
VGKREIDPLGSFAVLIASGVSSTFFSKIFLSCIPPASTIVQTPLTLVPSFASLS